jgi:hypothetical protein
VRHGVASGKRGGQLIFVPGSYRTKRRVVQPADRVVSTIRAARDQNDVVTLCGEHARQMSADEPRSSGDGNSHDVLDLVGRAFQARLILN